MSSPPILDNKDPDVPSVFEPTALLREARRQKGLVSIDVPPVCILDPDGDIVRRLKSSGQAKRFGAFDAQSTTLTAELQNLHKTEGHPERASAIVGSERCLIVG